LHLSIRLPTETTSGRRWPYHSGVQHVEIYRDPDDLARAAAARIGAWLRADGHDTLGLAGGSTPRLTYEFLRTEDVPWERTQCWLTDERHVPIDDADSNGGMANASLIDHVASRLHAIEFDPDPARAAARYSMTLNAMWKESESTGRGLMLLGLGDDGHTASLFPGTEALDADTDFVANWVPAKDTWRLTATVPLLASAEQLIFLVAGAGKAEAVASILESESSLPAAIVSQAASDPVWMLDAAAASGLCS
jgi:6-phosphogluconolactonase